MLLLLVFTSLLVNTLCLPSRGSIELNQTKAFLSIKSELGDLKSAQELIKVDQQLVRMDVGIIRSDQQQIRSDLELIKGKLIRGNTVHENTTLKTKEISSDNELIEKDLTLLKTGLKSIESMFNVVLEKLNSMSDMKKEEATTQPPKVSMARSCAEAMTTSGRSGIYDISIPNYYEQPFKVACSAETRGGNWTIILQRMDGSENFNRKWAEYKEGFGNLTGEFFLGLDKIYALTNDQPQELFVLLEDFEGEIRYEAYDAFAIGDELDLYKLHTLGKATGSAGDSFSYHHGMNFSSQDRDNDTYDESCAKLWTSGWWYRKCHESNLMGKFKDNTSSKGINWKAWHGYEYSLKRAVMMIRPKKI